MRLNMLAGAAALLAVCGAAMAAPFTFQGELRDGGTPVNGVYDFQFSLFGAAVSGTQFGSVMCADNVAVVDGRFTVVLDFGDVFDGTERYLEIQLRADTGLACGNSASFGTLGPRAQVTNAPMAGFASQAGTATSATSAANATNLNGQPATFYQNATNLTGTLADARLSANVPKLNNASSTFTGAVSANSFAGSGASLTALNAGNLASGTVADARLSANIPKLNTSNTFVGGLTATSFSGSGSLLTGLSASNVTQGLLSDARLSSNVPFKSDANTFSGVNTFSSLVNLNAGTNVNGFVDSMGLATGIYVRNPNNNSASVRMDWLTDVARLRLGGSGVGVSNGLDIQGPADVSLMRVMGTGNVGLGTTAPGGRLHVSNGPSGVTLGTAGDFILEDNSSAYLQLLTPDVSERGVAFGSPASSFMGGVYYTNTSGMSLRTGGNLTRMTVTPAGDVGIGTSTPTGKLEVVGGAGDVVLPDSSIAASEIADEPGIAFRNNTTAENVAMDLVVVSLATRTITAPADGFVFILATVQATRDDSLPGSFLLQVREGSTLSFSEPTESLNFPGEIGRTDHQRLTLQRVVPVTAGAHSFTLYGRSSLSNNTADMRVVNKKLTLMYFPSSYGVIDP